MDAITPQYKTVEPYTIKQFDYPPTKRQALAVKNIIKFYPFDLKSICNRYNKTGRKILVVTDDFITYRERGDSDLDRGCIFSGEEGGVLQNIYAYCMGQTTTPESIKEITTLNWAFGRIVGASKAKSNAQTIQAIETANRAFLRRLKFFIQDYEPDVVVLAGLDMAHYVLSNLKGDDQTNHRIYTNRLIKATVGEHNFKVMGCIDVKRPCSWEGVQVKEEPSLIGFFCWGFIQALNGRNTYTLTIPEDVRFINVNTIERFDRMMRQMWREKIVSIDTETDGLGRLAVTLYTAQFCWDGKTGYVLAVDHPDTPFTVKERKYIKAQLKRYFEYGKSLYHIYQNGKFDIAVFYATLGMRHYNHRVYDIQAGEFTFDENKKLLAQKTLKYSKPHEGRPFKPYALDFIAESYGCKIYRNIEFSKGNRGKISTEGLTKRFVEYAAYDVIVPFHIQEIQIVRAKRAKMRKFLKFVCEQLGDTVVACAGMEHVGAYVSKLKLFNLKDRNGPLRTLHDKLVKEYETSEAAIQVNDYLKKKQGVPESKGVFRTHTWLFDIKNQQHQQLIFFKALKLEGLANKKDSTDFQVNAKFKKTYADVPDVQRFNDIIKVGTVSNTFIKPTYVKIVEDRDCSLDSHIRSVFDYIYVSSGRLSSSKPNLQNLPSRGELAKYVKDIYEAEPGTLIIENDYSAHEVREWGNEAQDTILCDTFYTALKYRQEFRILVSKYEENLVEWYAIKQRVEWDKKVDKKPVHTYEGKLDIVRGINNPVTREIGFAELELEAKGDIHKLNCVRFFSLNSPLEVTESQRYEIKAIVFGTIYGKCLSSSSIFHSTLGSLSLVEAWNFSKKNKFRFSIGYKGFKDLNARVATHDGYAEAQLVYRTRGKTVTVQTNMGDEIKGLKEHQLWVFENKEYKFKSLEQLNAGDWLPKSIGTELYADEVPKIDYTKSKHVVTKDVIKIPKELNCNLATLFGWYVAEGDAHGRFYNKDEKVKALWLDLIKKEFGVEKVFNGERCHINKELQKFFNHYLGSVKSAKRFIPLIIRQAPYLYQRAFLQALWEGDGSIWAHQGLWLLEYTTISKRLAYQVKALMENMGILCAVYSKMAWATNGSAEQAPVRAWYVRVLTTHFEQFSKKIGFMCGNIKQTMLDKAVETIQSGRFNNFGRANTVPGRALFLDLYDRLDFICKNTSYSYTMKNRWGSQTTATKTYKLGAIVGSTHHVLKLRRSNKDLSRGALETLLQKINNCPIELKRAIYRDVTCQDLIIKLQEINKHYWTQVTKKRNNNKEEWVYDLNVPGPHSYHVNGLISHNTAAGLAKPVAELGLGKPVEYCEDLIATLFKTFPDGHQFLLRENKFGRENLYVENKLGMQRHLWAYLHNRPAFLNGADRRGPNTILQGTASQIGITSIREMQRMMWHFFIKQGVDISWKTITNYVHDSVKSQSPYYFVPVYLYMIEHASSTLIHKRYRELFDYKLKVGLELEFQIGESLAKTEKWDFTTKNLLDTCENAMTTQAEKLGHEINIKKEMKTIRHNWNIIKDIRLRELEKSVKSKDPSEYMIMNAGNSLDWGLKLPFV